MIGPVKIAIVYFLYAHRIHWERKKSRDLENTVTIQTNTSGCMNVKIGQNVFFIQ